MKINDLGEFGFIDRIKKGCLNRRGGVVAGIGDDCAVFRTTTGTVVLFTTDMLVEDVHFKREFIPPHLLGRKSLAVNISDIAAMGGIPKEALVSVAVPKSIDIAFLDKLYDGLKSMAAEHEVNLLGGDTVSSPDRLVINIALTGEGLENEILYRNGAAVGDIIFLTGSVGCASAGLDILERERSFDGWEELLDAHFNPHPHVKEGRVIASTKKANVLIDVSDGVIADLRHICRQSGVGALIEYNLIPLTEKFRLYCAEFNLDREKFALHGGEDYVLLGTVPEGFSDSLGDALKSEKCDYFPIGRITEETGMRLDYGDGNIKEIKPSGYDHFMK